MLKIIACLLMLIDHVGAALFPEVIILRMVGRLSFPIFAYLIAMGYSKTNSFSKYFYRLLIFAAISQIPFSLAFNEPLSVRSFSDVLRFLMGSPSPHLNVFFTLAIGLLAISTWDTLNLKYSKIFAVLALGLLAETLSTDYGIYGVGMILTFYVFRDNKIKTIISQTIVYIVLNESQVLVYLYEYKDVALDLTWFIQGISLASLIFIFKYNGNKGKDLRYAFYAFYPVHLLVIGLIKILI